VVVIDIPGRTSLRLSALVLDLNGTLTVDGHLIEGVAEKLARLSSHLSVYLVTADTRGTAFELAEELGVKLKRIQPEGESEAKRDFLSEVGASSVVAVGNGANDAGMLEAAALGIGVIGPEGLSTAALLAADIVVPGVTEALDLVLKPGRTVATLRH
jgi:P-type E1-E2 ATPase